MNAPRVGVSGCRGRLGRGPVTLRRPQPRAFRQRTCRDPPGRLHRTAPKPWTDRSTRSQRSSRRRQTWSPTPCAGSTSRSWPSDSCSTSSPTSSATGVVRRPPRGRPRARHAARPRRPGGLLRGRERRRARPDTRRGPREARVCAPRRPGRPMPTLVATLVPETLSNRSWAPRSGLGWPRATCGRTPSPTPRRRGEPSGHRRARHRARSPRHRAAITVIRRWARKLSRDLAAGVAILGRPRTYLTGVVSWQLAGRVVRLAAIACCLSACRLPGGPAAAARRDGDRRRDAAARRARDDRAARRAARLRAAGRDRHRGLGSAP